MTTMTTAVPVKVIEPHARFRDLVAAEWTKIWSLRSTYWVFGAGALFLIGVCTSAAINDYNNLPHFAAEPNFGKFGPPFDPLQDAFIDSAYRILVLAAGSVGAITLVGEYSSGLIRTTFAAIPARRSVVAAKALVATVVTLVAGAVIAGLSFGITQAILSGRHVGDSISDPGVFRAVAASALLAPVCALVGIAIGSLVRHSAGTVLTTVGVLLLLPVLVDSSRHRWTADLHNAMPIVAWSRLIDAKGIHSGYGAYPATITGSWIVYAGWSAGAVLLTMFVVHRRDV